MGLIARAIEQAGIPTVSISITRDLTESVGVPRAVFVKWPLGHPLGEPGNVLQQRTVIFDALKLLITAEEPGIIVEPGYRWRRETYSEPDWTEIEIGVFKMSRSGAKKKSSSKPKSAKSQTSKSESSKPDKGPIRFTGILFALAANLFLVTVADALVRGLGMPISFEVLATLVAPFIAGTATALYVKQRGGMHAFIGGLLSIPLLTFQVFGGFWQFGVLAGAFCGLAGSLTEIFLRRGRQSG